MGRSWGGVPAPHQGRQLGTYLRPEHITGGVNPRLLGLHSGAIRVCGGEPRRLLKALGIGTFYLWRQLDTWAVLLGVSGSVFWEISSGW